MSDQIKTVGVIGLGVMGFDIAFLYAMKGFRTLVYDAAKSMTDALNDRREQTIDRLQKRSRISLSEVKNLRALLKPSADLAGMSQCDLITDAVSENTKTKLAVYKTLREAEFIGMLATNTSSVTRATLPKQGIIDKRNFALSHSFNPALYTQMVEFVQGNMDPSAGQSLTAPELLTAMASRKETFYKNQQANPWLLSRVS